MKRILLSTLIKKMGESTVHGFHEVEIDAVAYRPDQIRGDCVFVCMDEYLQYNQWQTWRAYLERLPDYPLRAVILPERVDGLPACQIVVKNPRQKLGVIASMLSPLEENELQIIGVTGTNGKTTTTRLISELLSRPRRSLASLGTLGLWMDGEMLADGNYTTPLGRELRESFYDVLKRGGVGVAMEVSSHALALDRVEGVQFDAAVLTNLERDHLDFHGTEAAYAEAKLSLFKRLKKGGFSVLNKSSKRFDDFYEIAKRSGEVITYGTHENTVDLKAKILKISSSGTAFEVGWKGETGTVESPMVGAFQVENLLASFAVWLGFGGDFQSGLKRLSTFRSVKGRMERWDLPNGATVIIDYAHNPDGLKNLLKSSRAIAEKQLLLVFGCGGDRDKGKRPLMGELAMDWADHIFITSDNPRTEDPLVIMDEIERGCIGKTNTKSVKREPDRELAIRLAIESSRPGDLIVIAGKGHEDYQIVGHEKRSYSDQGVVQSLGGVIA